MLPPLAVPFFASLFPAYFDKITPSIGVLHVYKYITWQNS